MKKTGFHSIAFSLIIPVYNRPLEVEELLESLCSQTMNNFEVVLVEDGSVITCRKQADQYASRLNLKYCVKENSGPGLSRNFGSEKATGNYLIFLDSDCVIPPEYIEVVYKSLSIDYVDAFGGPDQASPDFTPLQKAINTSMTSFFTTGGIRGGGEKLDKFYPRSFNMGFSKDVYLTTKGFSEMRFGEDIDLSIRIMESGFKTKLIREAYVYHKRRTHLKKFFKQVYNSGIARINLYRRHPRSLKWVHLLPSLFLLFSLCMITCSFIFSLWFLTPLITFLILLFIDSASKNRNLKIALLSVITGCIQLFGYGSGFITAVWKRLVFARKEFSAFEKNFYN